VREFEGKRPSGRCRFRRECNNKVRLTKWDVIMRTELRWLKTVSSLFTKMARTHLHNKQSQRVVTSTVTVMTRLCYFELQNWNTRVCLRHLRQYYYAVMVMLLWLRDAVCTREGEGGHTECPSLPSARTDKEKWIQLHKITRPKGEICVTETWLQRAKSHKRKQWY